MALKTKVEIAAKSIDEAITTGCAELGVGIDEVDFEVLDEGGLFRKMKVQISLKEDSPARKSAKEDVAFSASIPNPEQKTVTSAPEYAEKNPAAELAAAAVPAEDSSLTETAVVPKNPAQTPVIPTEKGTPVTAKNKSFHEVLNGNTDEYTIEGRQRPPRSVKAARPERPVTEFDPNAAKFVKSLEFAKSLFGLLADGLTFTADHNDCEFIINVHGEAGEDVSRLIGKEGKTLTAINTLVSSVAINNSHGESRRVVVDIENYREKRRESLIALGKRKAEWVKESGRSVKLEPMPARERAVIHTALQDIEGIATHSVGGEPNRYLVIEPSAR
jgi:predicted RNA-binding protein Jag